MCFSNAVQKPRQKPSGIVLSLDMRGGKQPKCNTSNSQTLSMYAVLHCSKEHPLWSLPVSPLLCSVLPLSLPPCGDRQRPPSRQGPQLLRIGGQQYVPNVEAPSYVEVPIYSRTWDDPIGKPEPHAYDLHFPHLSWAHKCLLTHHV